MYRHSNREEMYAESPRQKGQRSSTDALKIRGLERGQGTCGSLNARGAASDCPGCDYNAMGTRQGADRAAKNPQGYAWLPRASLADWQCRNPLLCAGRWPPGSRPRAYA